MGIAASLPMSTPPATNASEAVEIAAELLVKKRAMHALDDGRAWRRAMSECFATTEQSLLVGALWAEDERDDPLFIDTFRSFSVQITELAVMSRTFMAALEGYLGTLSDLYALQRDHYDAVKRATDTQRRMLLIKHRNASRSISYVTSRAATSHDLLRRDTISGVCSCGAMKNDGGISDVDDSRSLESDIELGCAKAEFEEAVKAVAARRARLNATKSSRLPSCLSSLLIAQGVLWIGAARLFDQLKSAGSLLVANTNAACTSSTTATGKPSELDPMLRKKRLKLLKKWKRVAESSVLLWKDLKEFEKAHVKGANDWLCDQRAHFSPSASQDNSSSYVSLLDAWNTLLHVNPTGMMQAPPITVHVSLSTLPLVLGQVLKRETDVVSDIRKADPAAAGHEGIFAWISSCFQIGRFGRTARHRHIIVPTLSESSSPTLTSLAFTESDSPRRRKQLHKIEAAKYRLAATLIDNRNFRRQRLAALFEEIWSAFASWSAEVGEGYRNLGNSGSGTAARSPPAYEGILRLESPDKVSAGSSQNMGGRRQIRVSSLSAESGYKVKRSASRQSKLAFSGSQSRVSPEEPQSAATQVPSSPPHAITDPPIPSAPPLIAVTQTTSRPSSTRTHQLPPLQKPTRPPPPPPQMQKQASQTPSKPNSSHGRVPSTTRSQISLANLLDKELKALSPKPYIDVDNAVLARAVESLTSGPPRRVPPPPPLKKPVPPMSDAPAKQFRRAVKAGI